MVAIQQQMAAEPDVLLSPFDLDEALEQGNRRVAGLYEGDWSR
jgi:hypothetical protein